MPLILTGSFDNFWNLLIGLFLLQNAGRAAQSATVQEQLAGLTAADAVTPNGPIVSANLSLREFANEFIIGKDRWERFLVTGEEGQLVGAIAVDNLKTIPTDSWPQTPVSQLMQAVDLSKTVQAERSLLDVVTLLEQQQLSALPVIRENGVLVGLLEKASVIRLLLEQKTREPHLINN